MLIQVSQPLRIPNTYHNAEHGTRVELIPINFFNEMYVLTYPKTFDCNPFGTMEIKKNTIISDAEKKELAT